MKERVLRRVSMREGWGWYDKFFAGFRLFCQGRG